MTLSENAINKELVEEELKMLVQFIEQHVRWAKSDDNKELARLSMVTAESLIEAARLIETLCERLSQE